MDREFLDLYNRELSLLYEHAEDFADEYPGIAERLGGLIRDRSDPMISGLLEGAAFLAARVQLKLKHEFPEFTANLLEQLVPNYLAPTPSAMLVKVQPPYADPALRDGRKIVRGAYFDASYRERERSLACRFRLCRDIVLWPFDVTSAEYFATAGALQALGIPVSGEVIAGLRLSMTHRTAARLDEEPADAEARNKPETWFAGCRTGELPIYLTGAESDAIALYEQLTSNCVNVYFRYLDDFGDPVVIRAPNDCVQQVGFGEKESLFPNDNRVFRGSELLREYFLFPRKFLGINLTGLRAVMPRLRGKSIDIVFAFDEHNSRLAASVRAETFSLYTAPAINLFEKTTDRIPVKSNTHEYHVVPDRSRYLEYEPHQVLEVYAHFPAEKDKRHVRPLYSAEVDRTAASVEGLYFTVRRLPRRRTVEEKAYGTASDYTGTDMFLSLLEPGDLSGDRSAAELSVRALCSNRHLTEHLPVGQGGADFRLLDDTSLELMCIAGPTRPREPVVAQLRSRSQVANSGVVSWRLINMLSLNYLGLVESGGGKNAGALREMLSLFADQFDDATERKIRGARSIESRPVVRRVRERTGSGAARGLEITVTLDEKAFEGSGVFLLGAVLERFFADYSGFNTFTQTVISTSERGEIMRWPARMGTRRPL
ncbi:type VI secretion system baseplate subunit TssF [Bradyrhizobium uaiense]|uniref:Type VI secretion system baseplate subunit TssF n=1 Tax=Bradyrhizobium uaiense TaxID=2594946 RepID=A0A6P1BE15_9BRAD|nr:type VI secretion system baseplate subunit TssF [Bradyrhizobium uaiense]NEU96414.1 type VI secretion system baseplate subunit TssF [Bradyrhizobium uaiense]